jgi:hypothetical protein
MSTAAGAGGKQSGEVIKFVILILFMTSGGLALMSAVFYMFLIPSRNEKLMAQTRDSNALVDLVEKKNNAKTRLWDLRRSYNEAAKNPNTKTIRQIVEENLGGLQWSSFPATLPHSKGNTTESTQTIDLKDAPLQDILRFAAQIKQENPSVQLGHINLSRKAGRGSSSSAGADDDKWTAKLDFYTYTTTGGPGAAAKVAAPAPAESPTELPPEAPPEPPPADGK